MTASSDIIRMKNVKSVNFSAFRIYCCSCIGLFCKKSFSCLFVKAFFLWKSHTVFYNLIPYPDQIRKIFFFVFSYYGNNFFYFFSINLWSKFSYLFFMETKMSSCHRTFNNNKICCFFIFFIPEFQNNMGRFSGRYNGSDCNITIFYISRKINRKPCS